MNRFHFRLESLLRIRAHKERQWELRLAEATGHCLRLSGRISDLETERRDVSACAVGGIMYGLSDLQARGLYLRRLEKDVRGARDELAKREVERKKIAAEYQSASRDRKVLDKLKERKADEYYRLQLREEGKESDEIGQTMRLGER